MTVVSLDGRRNRLKAVDKTRILVVDDRSTVRMIIQRLLESNGYSVTVTTSGEEALHNLENYKFSLILLDIVMPGMDGLEVLKQVRKKYTMSELPVIMITVKGADDDIDRALSMGANEYIVKPIEFRLLHRLIQTLLTNKT